MTTLTPYQCGADAFDAGIAHDGHGLPAGHPNIDQWQAGWRARRDAVAQARYDRLTRPQADVMRSAPKASCTKAFEEFMRSLFSMVMP